MSSDNSPTSDNSGTTTPEMIVTIGVPTGEYFTVARDFFMSMTKMVAFSYDYGVDKIHLAFAASPSTANNRNAIAQTMHGDYMMQVDADMTFPEDTLIRLLETADKFPDAIITGLGFMGSPPFYPAIFKWSKERAMGQPFAEWPEEPFEIEACGSFGFLVPKKIIDTIGKNWFSHMMLTNPETKQTKEVRHDFAFCLRARERGFKIICDPRVKFGHIRPMPITEHDWYAMRDANITQPPHGTLPLDTSVDERQG